MFGLFVFGSLSHRDIISLVTAPSITPFIHNPARSDFSSFEFVKQAGREFIVPASNMKKSCFVVYGIVRESHLTELSLMGSSDWLNKRVEIYPLTADFVLAYNFFTRFLDVKGLSVFRDFVSIGTYPIGKHSKSVFCSPTHCIDDTRYRGRPGKLPRHGQRTRAPKNWSYDLQLTCR